MCSTWNFAEDDSDDLFVPTTKYLIKFLAHKIIIAKTLKKVNIAVTGRKL